MAPKTMKERLADDEHNETACEVINAILDVPEIVDAVIVSMHDDYQHRTSIHGSDPTKKDFAFHYIWDMIQEE